MFFFKSIIVLLVIIIILCAITESMRVSIEHFSNAINVENKLDDMSNNQFPNSPVFYNQGLENTKYIDKLNGNILFDKTINANLSAYSNPQFISNVLNSSLDNIMGNTNITNTATMSPLIVSGNTVMMPTMSPMMSGNAFMMPTMSPIMSGNAFMMPTMSPMMSGNAFMMPTMSPMMSGNTFFNSVGNSKSKNDLDNESDDLMSGNIVTMPTMAPMMMSGNAVMMPTMSPMMMSGNIVTMPTMAPMMMSGNIVTMPTMAPMMSGNITTY